MKQKIAIIGAGVMGKAIAKGLLAKKIVVPQNLFLTNIVLEGLEEFSEKGVIVSKNNIEAVKAADVVLLTVKPQIMDSILEEIKDFIDNKLVISIAAGISIAHMQQFLGNKKIVRVMPNLAAQVGESMSCWICSKEVKTTEKELAKEILTSIGKEIALTDESQIDIITPISGSGPAYVFLLAELLEKEAIAMGINAQNAHLLALQTVIGSAKVMQNAEKSFEELRLNVTSKGGVTQEVVQTFEENKLREIFKKAIQNGFNKSKQLNKLK